MKKWNKEKEQLEYVDSYQDIIDIFHQKGFIEYGDGFTKIVYTHYSKQEGFEYELKGCGKGNCSIFRFKLSEQKEYIIQNLLFKGYIHTRKQLIKTLNFYF